MDTLALLEDRAGEAVPTYASWIGGHELAAGPSSTIDVVDPATGRQIARIAEAGTSGVALAVEAGTRAFETWRRVPARDRGALVAEFARRVEENADRLARLDSLDTGNPLAAMRADVTKGARQLADSAGLALELKGTTYPLPGLHATLREPWGVVGRMITFNHPVMFACARLGPALVAGNAVVLKPSELAPLGALALAELAAAVLPDGLVSVVVGGPSTGEALVRHPEIRRLSFTGSTATALRIQAAAADSGRVKTITFELGGKNPIVVCPDVDLDEVAAAVVRGMNFTRVQGQSCGSTSRLVVHESIAEDVLDRVGMLAGRIRLGLPAEPSTEMGSMISRPARDRCLSMVDEAVSAGARVRVGGVVPDDAALAGGAYLAPTVVDRVEAGSRLATEEIFGPILAAQTWRTEGEALAIANAGPYGLTAAVWSRDIDRAFRLAAGIDAGYVWINDVETRFPAVPFGGWGDSGVGVEHGLDEILSFTRLKAINVRVRPAED